MMPILDLDRRFYRVVIRAMRNHPIAGILDMLRPGICPRAMASNRLWIRRWAARRQGPGESWSYLDHIALVDAELERMKVPAEMRGGCLCFSCLLCNAPRSCGCGGGSCAAPA